jgi:hypothetical protein
LRGQDGGLGRRNGLGGQRRRGRFDLGLLIGERRGRRVAVRRRFAALAPAKFGDFRGRFGQLRFNARLGRAKMNDDGFERTRALFDQRLRFDAHR